MQLEMKTRCEKCDGGLLPTGKAYICSYECTFCVGCSSQLNEICPHCGGELLPRPRRISPLTSDHAGKAPATTSIRSWVIWAVSFGVWGLITAAAFMTVTHIYRSRGYSMAYRETLGMECSQILPYAVLTPFVFTFASRYAIRRKNWVRYLILYLAVGLAFSFAHVALTGMMPFGFWDGKDRGWQSAVWNSQIHKFRINWPVYQSLFFSNVVDDVSGAYLPIVLSAYMISFYRSSRERERRAVELEGQLAKANLQALKAQLQPHFLFNTMHSISALMLTDARAADQMMSRLSDLLRMSLENDGEQITSLSHELELVAGYLEIEKIRFGDRLNVVLDVANETLDAQVPHFLLQPLVENAVRHGIAKVSKRGEIRMTVTHQGDTLHLVISDNGPGLDDLDTFHWKSGLGLRATQERLQTLYGDRQKLEIRTHPDGGVEASIRIPFQLVHDNSS